MRIALNLASQPFIELRPLYARLRLWMMLLAILAIPLGLLLQMEQRRAADADAQMEALQSKIQSLRNQQASFQTLMRQPANAAVLSQSEFLNQLFARKSFSWTAVMMDLEDVLPAGVQVQNIDPIVRPGGHVTIRLRVAGPRERAVDLVRNLERSRRFLQPRLASESAETATNNSGAGNLQGGFQGGFQPGQFGGQPGAVQPVSAASSVNFDILADYNPLPNLPQTEADSSLPPAQAVSLRHRRQSSSRAAAMPGRSRSHARQSAPPQGGVR